MKGMEIMFAGMLKSLGIDPAVLMKHLSELVDAAQSIKTDQREILERLRRLESVPVNPTEIETVNINGEYHAS